MAVDTLVGGMFEQQITMKGCIFPSPSLHGGITEEQLKEYMNMDLANDPPTDLHYINRRKLSISHRIGGNPELTNQTVRDYKICVPNLHGGTYSNK